METDSIGGSEHTVPAHAMVMILGLRSASDVPAQDTITTGTGASMVEGFNETLVRCNI